MAFPVAKVAWWKSRIGAVLFALVILFFLGPGVVINWPHVGAAASMVGSLVLWPFLISAALLALVAFTDHQNERRKNAQPFV